MKKKKLHNFIIVFLEFKYILIILMEFFLLEKQAKRKHYLNDVILDIESFQFSIFNTIKQKILAKY